MALDFDLLVHGELRLLLLLPLSQTGPPDNRAGADEDLLPLVVEVGTAVDVVEVLEGETLPAPLLLGRLGGEVARPGDWRAGRWDNCALFSLASNLADGLAELCHLPQGNTVLRVVGQELFFPDRLPALLPACPPHQGLEA